MVLFCIRYEGNGVLIRTREVPRRLVRTDDLDTNCRCHTVPSHYCTLETHERLQVVWP